MICFIGHKINPNNSRLEKIRNWRPSVMSSLPRLVSHDSISKSSSDKLVEIVTCIGIGWLFTSTSTLSKRAILRLVFVNKCFPNISNIKDNFPFICSISYRSYLQLLTTNSPYSRGTKNVQKYSLKSSQSCPLKAQSLLVSVLQYGRVSMDNSSSGAKYWEKCFIYEEALLQERKCIIISKLFDSLT